MRGRGIIGENRFSSVGRTSLPVMLLFFFLHAAAWAAPVAPTVYVSWDGTGDYNCDGTSDNLEINEALVYVSTHPGFTTVYLKGPHSYLIANSVKVGSNTTLTGDASAVIKLKDHANWPKDRAMVTMMATGNHDITICGFEINGNETNNTDTDTATGATRARGQNYYDMLSFTSVTNLDIHNMYIHDNMNDGLALKNCTYVYYHDNQILKHGHDGLYGVTSNYVYVYNNRITIRTNAGMRFYNSNHCKAYGNTISKDSGGWCGFEIEFSSSTMDDIEIYNNVCYGTAGPGVWMFPEASSAYASTKACNVRIHNNVFYGCNGGIRTCGFFNTIIENNVIDGCGSWGISQSASSTSYDPPSGMTGFTTIARNNIIYGNTYGIQNLRGATDTVTSYNNCFYGNTSANFSGPSINTSNELLNVDPLFINRGGRDYHLQSKNGRWTAAGWVYDAASSPCIDAGYASSDYANEPVPNGGRVNIGAYGNTDKASKSPYRLMYAASGNGYLTGVLQQRVDRGGSGAPVTANANSGSYFYHWSDNATANPRLDAAPEADISVTAVFLTFASPVWVNFDFTGAEAGTELAPFNTLDEAMFGALDGGTVRIYPGSIESGGRYVKAMRLEAVGGTVRIGRK